MHVKNVGWNLCSHIYVGQLSVTSELKTAEQSFHVKEKADRDNSLRHKAIDWKVAASNRLTMWGKWTRSTPSLCVFQQKERGRVLNG